MEHQARKPIIEPRGLLYRSQEKCLYNPVTLDTQRADTKPNIPRPQPNANVEMALASLKFSLCLSLLRMAKTLTGESDMCGEGGDRQQS